jgi:hypothetical protein
MRVDARNQVSKHLRAQRPEAVVIGRPFSPVFDIERFLGKTLLLCQSWDSAPEFGAFGHCEERKLASEGPVSLRRTGYDDSALADPGARIGRFCSKLPAF